MPVSRLLILLGLVLLSWPVLLPAQVAAPSLRGIFGVGSVDLGQRVTLQPLYSGSQPTAGNVYQWYKNGEEIPGAIASTFVIETATAADGGTYGLTVANSAGSSSVSGELIVRPLAAMVFTAHPRNLTVQVGQQAVFFFTATGSFPRTYQWRKNGVDIVGANAATYSIPVAGLDDAGSYSVVVTNNAGPTVSNAATLIVNAATPIVIANGSPQDATAVQGQSAALQVFLNMGSPPLTYQWSKDGVPVAGATAFDFKFPGVALTDAGNYSVAVSNPAGTATSRRAMLTVTPATPVRIVTQPQGVISNVGGSANFAVGFEGSSPVTMQWLKNGQPISGAINSHYSLNELTAADAGSYAVTVTNAAGSVTSNAADLTVNPAVPVIFTTHPVGATFNYGERIGFTVQVTGSAPLRYQWKVDGRLWGGAYVGGSIEQREIRDATTADAGAYTVEVTNAAGTTISNPAIVIVRPPVLPAILRQPASLQVASGSSVSFSVDYQRVGTGAVTLQWFKNGVTIPAANSTNYSINQVSGADAAYYWVTISGPGGTVTSEAVRLTPLPAVPPIVQSWPFDMNVSLGTQIGPLGGFGIPYPGGTFPFRVQWFKDGGAIPGASAYNLAFPAVTTADLGTYTLVVANDAGVVASPGIRLALEVSTAAPWVEAAQEGEIVYFLALAPSRIERYDLTGQRWLPTVALASPTPPTRFVPTPEGIYLAYGRALVWRSLDLGAETPLANATSDIRHLFVAGEWVYYAPGGGNAMYGTIRRSSQLPGPSTPASIVGVAMRHGAFAPGLRRLFGNDEINRTVAFNLADDGTMTPIYDPLNALTASGSLVSRAFVFPGEKVFADNFGAVHRTSDLTYVGSLGKPFHDLAFRADGAPLLLRGDAIVALRKDAYIEEAKLRLSTPGHRLVVRGEAAFVFGAAASAGGPFAVQRVELTTLASPPAPGVMPAPSEPYSVDGAYLGADGVVHVLSRSLQGLVRWSGASRSFLPTVRLRSAPKLLFQQPEFPRVVVAYGDGVITEVPLGAEPGVERGVGLFANQTLGLADFGTAVAVHTTSFNSSRALRFVIGAAGDTTSVTEWTGQEFLAFHPVLRRAYARFQNEMFYETYSAAGARLSDGFRSSPDLAPPLRFNADATLAVSGNGRVVDPDFGAVGTLSTSVLDAAWLRSALFTLRQVNGQAQIQRWSRANYLETGSVYLRGTPVRIFRLSDTEVVAITAADGYAVLTVVGADLSLNRGSASTLAIGEAPRSQTVGLGGTATLNVSSGGGSGPVSYQWHQNGNLIAAPNLAALAVQNVAPANAGIYTATVLDAAGSAISVGAILGVTTVTKVVGTGAEVGANIVHANGNVYDQVLLEGTAATVKADPGQIVRVSFTD
ncbi:MAG: hypothetical protein ABIZ49_13980, partial [Opitutaceae bacterium]